ncbi:MAG: hypothetical protein IJW19_03420 [Clostridia bacterium]|nr:hypothetical protein [Clostridia bacterium]
MKKTLVKILALAVVAVFALSMIACGGGPQPNLDLEDAADNLRDNGYLVTYNDDFDDPGIVATLNATDDSYNYIRMIEYKDSTLAKLSLEEYEMRMETDLLEFEYEIKELELEIEQLEHYLDEYADKLSSDEEDDLEDELEDAKDDLEEAKEELEDYKKENSCGRSGNIVWYGKVDAIEDTKE